MAWIADAILQRQIVLLRADRRVRSRNDRCALLPADARDTRIQQKPTVSVCVRESRDGGKDKRHTM